MSPERSDMIDRALEFYADALAALAHKHASSTVQPEVGEVLQKIAKLYGQKGAHAEAARCAGSAVETARRVLAGGGIDETMEWVLESARGLRMEAERRQRAEAAKRRDESLAK